jgi:hypothetical protein
MPLSRIFQLYRGTDCLGSCKSANDHDYDAIMLPTVSSTNKTDRYDIAEILLKVALNTIKQTNKQTNKQT